MSKESIIVLVLSAVIAVCMACHRIARADQIENGINFEEVMGDDIPSNVTDMMDNYKYKTGFVYYVDDNTGYFYIGIMNGQKPTDGYSVKVTSVENNNGKTEIIVREINPDYSKAIKQIITYPETVIRVKGITSDITVKNTSGGFYSYYNLIHSKRMPAGVGHVQGILKKIENDNINMYITIQKRDGNTDMYYSSIDTANREILDNLNIGDSVCIRYAIGIPAKYNGSTGFPFSDIIRCQGWINIKNCSNVSEDKKWKINLRDDISEYNINDKTIYVEDSKGDILSTVLKPDSDKKSITVIPVQKYLKGQTYYLYISKDINYSGIQYIKGYSMKFSINGNHLSLPAK